MMISRTRPGARRRLLTVTAAAALMLVAACSGGGQSQSQGQAAAAAKVTRGGVYRTAVSSFGLTDNLDPTGEDQIGFAFAIYDATLRTLVGFRHVNGPAGLQIVPDLATSVPTPTDGGLTYTFHLKSGIRFAPPVNREITSYDIAYAFQRINDATLVPQYGYYYDGIIKGLTGTATSENSKISGIVTPDPQTIVFHLTSPTGDFLQRLAQPAAAPVPPEVGKCFTQPGTYGRDLISSGPYMIAGAAAVNISSCSAIKAMSGFDPTSRLTLVRNPNYVQSTDDTRANYVNGVQISVDPNVADIFAKVQKGQLDGSMIDPPPAVTTLAYLTSSQLRQYFHSDLINQVESVTMNLDVPPFTDVHVRQAVAWVLDKSAMLGALGGTSHYTLATHIIPPTLPGGLPVSYDPYGTPGETGDLAKAQAEMRLSAFEANVRVPMRDGVTLAADIFRPSPWPGAPAGGAEPAVTLLARTPYNKNTAEHHERARAWASGGYNFVWMDVRGRGDSDGAFAPYRGEGRDGYDTVEWIARQPWSNGQVVTWGGSYLGAIQWQTALEHPPHLAAMIVYVAPSDPFEDYPTGLHIPWEICWLRMLDGRVQQYVEGTDWPAVAWHLPLLSMDCAAGFRSEHWRADLTHPVTDRQYWDPVRYQARLTQTRVPALHITGWYDDVQRGTLTNFTLLTSPDAPAEVRENQWLVVGPWDHRCTSTRQARLGAVTFGPGAEVDLRAVERDWLAAVLAGARSRQAPVRIFVMGRNEWRDEREWPLARTLWTRYFLVSGGAANSRYGDGELRREEKPEGDQPPDRFTYDPADPVPFLSDFASSSQIGGPDDYAAIEERGDVLVYSTAPLNEDVEITGPVRLRLHASSTAVDTDFTAKLTDVHPGGFSQRLCDGMVRARFRHGYGRPEELLVPEEITEYEIDMWSVSHVFLAGHRMRLEVSSSAFPKYDRNLNTGAPLATGSKMLTAVNTVWHDEIRPSHLILPEVATERSHGA